jgi:tyrosine-protein kinase Etk/Wzc
MATTEPKQMDAVRDAHEDGSEIDVLDLLHVVADNLRLLVLAPLLAGLLALAYSYTIKPVFQATTKFMPPQQSQGGAAALLQGLNGALGGLAGVTAGIKTPADQYIAFLRSRSIQNALIDRFQLMRRYKAEVKEDARDALNISVQTSSGKDGLITVEVSDHDPQFAAQLANAHVEELGKLLSRLAVTEAQQRRVFFERQLGSAKDNLVKAEQALRSSGVNSSILKTSPQNAVEGLARLKANITEQEVRIAAMRGYLTPSAPAFKQAQTEAAALRSQLALMEKKEPSSDNKDDDYIAKYRDFKYYETLFELFAKQVEMARVDESREGAILQVLDVAQVPERKSRPKRAMMAIMTTVTTLLSLMLFLIIGEVLRGATMSPASSAKLLRLRHAWRRSLGLRRSTNP